MAHVKFNRSEEGYKCTVSDIVLKNSKDSDCCDGLFQYQTVVLDFGVSSEDVYHRNAVIQSKTNALFITTQFQTLCLMDITDMTLMDGAKMGVKFENLIMY